MKKIKIIIAEDNRILRKSLIHLLESCEDFEIVGEAEDGQMAIEMVRNNLPDIALMDITIPIIDGIRATRQIRDISMTTEVLILTCHSDNEYLFSAIQAGAIGYILKDCNSEELITAIHDVANGATSFSPEISKKIIDEFRKISTKHSFNYEKQAFVNLTEREEDILELLSKGFSNQQIASNLYLSERTIRNQITGIYRKLEVNARTEALVKAVKLGLVEIG